MVYGQTVRTYFQYIHTQYNMGQKKWAGEPYRCRTVLIQQQQLIHLAHKAYLTVLIYLNPKKAHKKAQMLKQLMVRLLKELK